MDFFVEGEREGRRERQKLYYCHWRSNMAYETKNKIHVIDIASLIEKINISKLLNKDKWETKKAR